MTRLRLPYPLVLAWNQSIRVNSITCHEKVAESLGRILQNVLQLYGREAITALGLDQWGGCLNVRKTRGGSNYSIHSWGAANDWLPQENGLYTPWEKSRFSEPAYIDFVNAHIIEGWEPLGLSFSRDSMHFQATANEVRLLPTNQLLRAA
jgi:hypothetical protein